MLVKFNIDNETFTRIKQLIDDGKYPDIYEFITIAIKNQIHEEFSSTNSIFDDTSNQKVSILESVERLSDQARSEIKLTIGSDWWQKKIKEWNLSQSEILPEKEDLIWSFYNRFLPIKIVIRELAKIIAKTEDWVELTELQDRAYVSAIDIAKKLREYEDSFNISRNQKLSTGLPAPPAEAATLKGTKRRKKELKILSSKTRFTEQFVGKKTYRGGQSSFQGACFSMGLMAVKFAGNVCFVSLTEDGREFALLTNPIIDEGQKDRAFSGRETNFIVEKIIPRFKLEYTIVNKILDELKKHPLSAEEITIIIKEEKANHLKETGKSTAIVEESLRETVIIQDRIAIMGRLAELGLVNWRLDEKGHSTYSQNPRIIAQI